MGEEHSRQKVHSKTISWMLEGNVCVCGGGRVVSRGPRGSWALGGFAHQTKPGGAYPADEGMKS